MIKEDIKIGLKVKYDDEIVIVREYFPQINNTSPSGDVVIEDKDGFEELVNHNELELIETEPMRRKGKNIEEGSRLEKLD